MYSCPSCGMQQLSGDDYCAACGADLGLLRQLDSIADAWFNCGLESLRAGSPGRAVEWLSACCAARPSDAAARRALAKVWAQLGRWLEAKDALERARDIDPDALENQDILHAIEQGVRGNGSADTPNRHAGKSHPETSEHGDNGAAIEP